VEELETALRFASAQKLAVLSTVAAGNQPQSALMGIAVTPDFEVVFDTLNITRKYANLQTNSKVALVIGCTSGTSLQYEGVAEELNGEKLEAYLELYFGAFPDGRERRNWEGMTYFVVRPTWLRYCEYGPRPPVIREFSWPKDC
jgi:uncharacterized pyridoxamine 5'-phosphate oxidase family protein